MIATRSRAARLERRGARAAFAIDLALALGVTVAGLAVRLPYYQLIPVFTDETEEIYRGLLTARGQLAPLTNVDAYIGSLWNWLLAATVRASGFSLYAPRTVTL